MSLSSLTRIHRFIKKLPEITAFFCLTHLNILFPYFNIKFKFIFVVVGLPLYFLLGKCRRFMFLCGLVEKVFINSTTLLYNNGRVEFIQQ